MLLGAGCDQEIGDRKTMPASLPELSVSGQRSRDRLRVHTQVVKSRELLINLHVLFLRSCAVKHLQSRDRA